MKDLKRTIFVALLWILPGMLYAQEQFKVTGKLTGLTTDMKVMLHYRAGKDVKVDSAITQNGSFIFSGTINRPVSAYLSLKPADGTKNSATVTRQFYLCDGLTSVTGADLASAKIKGGNSQEEYIAYSAMVASVQDSVSLVRKLYLAKKTDPEILNKYVTSLSAKMDELNKEFILAHGDSYVSLDLIGQQAYLIKDTKAFDVIFYALSKNLRATPEGQKYEAQLLLTKKLDVGSQALNFTQNDVNGKPVSLSDFKGKYVLVDFWASWCGPCRAENPNVVKVYHQYKDKNFTVLGVSLDQPGKRDAWLAAIKNDGLEWAQVSDLKFWDNEIAKAYGIKSIPQNFLIDPSGKIVGKDLRGDALEKRLAELLK